MSVSIKITDRHTDRQDRPQTDKLQTEPSRAMDVLVVRPHS